MKRPRQERPSDEQFEELSAEAIAERPGSLVVAQLAAECQRARESETRLLRQLRVSRGGRTL